MKLDEVARVLVDASDRNKARVIVADWRGRTDLSSSEHVHVDRLKYRGMMVPRCAKRAVLFIASRIVEMAREKGSSIVAGHGDGGIVAALAAECARTELAFDAPARRTVVRSVSFGAPMRYPVRADVRVVSTRDARAVYPCGAKCGQFVFVGGPRDAAFYARMAMAAFGAAVGAAVGSGQRGAVVSMEQYASECKDPTQEEPRIQDGPHAHDREAELVTDDHHTGSYQDERSALEWVVIGD